MPKTPLRQVLRRVEHRDKHFFLRCDFGPAEQATQGLTANFRNSSEEDSKELIIGTSQSPMWQNPMWLNDPEDLHQNQLQDHQNHPWDHQNQLQGLENHKCMERPPGGAAYWEDSEAHEADSGGPRGGSGGLTLKFLTLVNLTLANFRSASWP